MASAGAPKQLAQTKTDNDGRFELRTTGAPVDSSLYLVAIGGVPTANKAACNTSAVASLAVVGNKAYLGGNQDYLYTPTGVLLKTITMVNCAANCDGLEHFVQNGKGYLIENRGDGQGPYDVYDLNGNLVTAALIPGTGLA